MNHESCVRELTNRKPKFVGNWARRDIALRYVGRIVSPKACFRKQIAPDKLGVILEIGPAMWTAVLWESGEVDTSWTARELDFYLGPENGEMAVAVSNCDRSPSLLHPCFQKLRASSILSHRMPKR